ncbi:hypothetical protein AUQ39_04810 [Lacticaseibacillus casei]|uniref:Uncharacterized protein n=1 Tax=Lacticaseibacillus zeae TaxID=57037 RepID=A0A5R8LY02_LACZE|nr:MULTISPECIES: hypothetical protein [Lacticaseibacillus]MDE3283909.1 hypothetical protein [Lacticaseibacillus casei]OLS09952.1 hypothetical protein AUQ39_04810 [Lacticaseibacillus casei]QVI31409.1 hypothetical protein KG087_10850 [Lacticaseibacillus zeae]TLF42180.1 hypothetical protein FEI14_07795 [Lacticaseibacillus zeae]
MDWFMRSDLAMELGIVLYVVFEILAVPIVSILTVHRKISNVMQGVTIFLSFILAVATPILVVTPLGSYLRVPNESFEIYISVLFAIMIAIPFIIVMAIDLGMLHWLRNPQNKYHDQIEYFQSGSIVFLMQALLIFEWCFLLGSVAAIYYVINPPKQIYTISKILMLLSLLVFPVILLKAWKGLLRLIKKVGGIN